VLSTNKKVNLKFSILYRKLYSKEANLMITVSGANIFLSAVGGIINSFGPLLYVKNPTPSLSMHSKMGTTF
jgi:hypothetical protein